MRLVLAILLSLALAAGAAGARESRSETANANRLLRAELDLARTPKVYFIFDLVQRRIRLKAAGFPVAEMPIAGLRLWGAGPAVKVHTLTGKETWFPPQRQKIEVAAGEPEKDATHPFVLQALELDDMPTSFRAELDDGSILTIRSAPEGLFSRLWEGGRILFWYLTRPLISDWRFLRGKPYTEVRLTLPARDVRLLYWSFSEGAPCLIAWPPTE